MQTAYHEGFVHADMSEYNVFVSSEGVTVFDWPQAVPTDHENARELLERDVTNVVGYFRRKYPQFVDEVDVPAWPPPSPTIASTRWTTTAAEAAFPRILVISE